jgi:hypothetical protein
MHVVDSCIVAVSLALECFTDCFESSLAFYPWQQYGDAKPNSPPRAAPAIFVA